jgi:flagellar hook assembly protein FlgD
MKVKGEGEMEPTTYSLFQNYPNPFNPTTTITYELPQTSNVRLEVFNILGQRVATLVNETQEAGFYQLQWDGRDNNHLRVASGMYLYRIQADKFSSVKKMLLVK